VNYVGQSVVEGEALARIYSPELYNAQQELVEARRPGGDSSLLSEAVRQRLRHLKLTDSQIAAIDREGSNPSFTYLAPYGGTVVSKAVSVGDYVESGSPLFELADLTSVWAVFEAYEKDLSFLHVGDALAYEVPWLPGERFSGQIAFISPWVDSESRTVEVRLRTENRQGQLKPGMTAVGMATASLGEQGLIVPREAVLWTGVRSGVWTKEGAVFKFREVELGTPGDQGYVVLSGLEEGEEVVTQGAFAVDAAAQLASSPSMLSPSPTLPSAGSSTGHSHHHHGH
jgi:Cu(I)/Ag(I) efflux system membrane fusion protein